MLSCYSVAVLETTCTNYVHHDSILNCHQRRFYRGFGSLFESKEGTSTSSKRSRQGPRGKQQRKLDMRRCTSIEGLIQRASDHLDSFSPKDIAAFYTLVSRFLATTNGNEPTNNEHGSWAQKRLKQQVEAILEHTLEQFDTFGYKHKTTTILGIAKIMDKVLRDGAIQEGSIQHLLHSTLIGNHSQSNKKQFILHELAASVVPSLSEFDNRSLSNVIYAFGLTKFDCKLDEHKEGTTTSLFDVFATEVIPRLGKKFNGQDLSNMLLAYANVGKTNYDLFKKVGGDIVDGNNLEEYSPRALSSIVWSYATLNVTHPQLFEKVGGHIVAFDNLHSFNFRALSNTVWAFAATDQHESRLFKKVADHISTIHSLQCCGFSSHSSDPRELTNLLRAYATANEGHPGLFKKVGDHIVSLPNLDGFDPHAFVNIVWAFASKDEPHADLFEKIAGNIVELDLDLFTIPDLSDLLRAYATVKVSSSKLFQKVANSALSKSRRKEFSAQSITNFVWAYATSGQLGQDSTTTQIIIKSLTSVAVEHIGEFSSQNLAHVAWAYSVSDVAAPTLFNDTFISACTGKEKEFTAKSLCQLHQWNNWQKNIKSDIELPPLLEERCNDAFIQSEKSAQFETH